MYSCLCVRPLKNTLCAPWKGEGIKKHTQLPSSRPGPERCGVIHSPLLNIELHHVVVDELHLLLHISDVLISNLIFQMVIQERRSAADQHHENYLDKLEKAVREIGVTFRVWEVAEVMANAMESTIVHH